MKRGYHLILHLLNPKARHTFNPILHWISKPEPMCFDQRKGGAVRVQQDRRHLLHRSLVLMQPCCVSTAQPLGLCCPSFKISILIVKFLPITQSMCMHIIYFMYRCNLSIYRDPIPDTHTQWILKPLDKQICGSVPIGPLDITRAVLWSSLEVL